MSRTPQAVAAHFSVPPGDLPTDLTVAPGRSIAAIRMNPDTHQRELVSLYWGLPPRGNRQSKTEDPLIFARAETVVHRGTLREAFERRRCLVPADGFYEWKREEHQKVLYFVRLRTGHLLALGAVWDTGKEGKATCAVLTTEGNDLVRPMHHRMPLIVRPEQYEAWLNPETPVEQVEAMLQAYPAREMTAYPVSDWVNRAGPDEPARIEPAQKHPGEEAGLFRPVVEETHKVKRRAATKGERGG